MNQCGICRSLYPAICPETDEICIDCRQKKGFMADAGSGVVSRAERLK